MMVLVVMLMMVLMLIMFVIVVVIIILMLKLGAALLYVALVATFSKSNIPVLRIEPSSTSP